MLISDSIEFAAARRPTADALLFEGTVTSNAELASRTRRVANALSAIASPGDRIALLSQNRAEYVECIYGVPRAGMALCFLNYRLNVRELVRIINDAEPSVLIVEIDYLETMRAVRAEIPSVRDLMVVGASERADFSYGELVDAATDAEPTAVVDSGSLAWLIYTSGTTGMPKGAMLTHDNVLAAAGNIIPKWSAHGGETLLAPWPMCHVAAVVFPAAHLLGWRVALMRSFDPVSYVEHIERHRVTTALGAPTMFNMLFDHPRFADFDLSSLRIVSYGSMAMPAEMLRRAMTLLPDVGWETNFGMTELGGAVYYLDARDHVRALAEDAGRLRSVGRQLAYSVARIVDERVNDIPVGAVGEIVVRGPMVMQGYWRRPEANVEAFLGGWFHTGDLGRVDDDGFLYVVDRKKDMIITGGENVYSREVEEVIYTHPAVAEVAVLGIPDEAWGENVIAAVQLRDGLTATEQEIVSLCRDNLAGYKKPKRVVFMTELPRNATGKFLKTKIREDVLSTLAAEQISQEA